MDGAISWPPTPAARPGQRPPGPRPGHPHLRDRHPAPHRRAGGPPDRRAGHLRVRGHVGRHRSTARDSKYPLEPIPRVLGKANPPSRRWSGTRTGSTRCRARCPLSRSRTWSPSATPSPCSSGRRWSAASPTRSRATSSSWAARAGWCSCSWSSCMGGVEDDRRLVAKDYSVTGAAWTLDVAMKQLADLSTEALARPEGGRRRSCTSRRAPASTGRCSRTATGCCTTSPACPRWWPTGWWPGSTTCRRSCGPR